MPDLVFVRANPALPVKEGAAVSSVPSALGSGSIYSYTRPGMNPPANGNAPFAQATLANRFRTRDYFYTDPSAAPAADNPAQPTF
jgi:hypothetical protein